MADPYSDEHAEIAETILGEAFDQLIAAGLGHVEACHMLVHAGVDLLPAFACRGCLSGEYEAIIGAVEERLEEVPSLPDDEVAQSCPEHMH